MEKVVYLTARRNPYKLVQSIEAMRILNLQSDTWSVLTTIVKKCFDVQKLEAAIKLSEFKTDNQLQLAIDELLLNRVITIRQNKDRRKGKIYALNPLRLEYLRRKMKRNEEEALEYARKNCLL